MKYSFWLFAATLGQTVVAGPVRNADQRPLSQEQIINTLLNRPHLFPSAVFRRIVEKHQNGILISKRQIANTGSWLEMIQDYGSSIFGSSSNSGVNTNTNESAQSPSSLLGQLSNPANLLSLISKYGSIVSQLPDIISAGSTAPIYGNAPKTTIPEVQVTQGVKFPEAKRVKVRYGPFRIPSQHEKNFNNVLWNVQGVSTDFHINVRRPCEKECTILSIEANLEYADGSIADTSSGAIFHHTVLVNAGPNVVEPTCAQPFIENIFMSGNERGPTDYAVQKGIKSGYAVEEHDTFLLNTELQNWTDQDKFVWEAITYEIMDGTREDYTPSKIVWLTIGKEENPSMGLCHYFGTPENPWGSSNLTGRDQPVRAVFAEHSDIWRTPSSAKILQAAGHLHDGGTHVDIFQGDALLCNSVARYEAGGDVGDEGAMMSMPMPRRAKRQLQGGAYKNTEIPHIVELSRCNFPAGRDLKSGDPLYMVAHYDLDKYKGIKQGDGKIDMIMGMAGVLVASNDL